MASKKIADISSLNYIKYNHKETSIIENIMYAIMLLSDKEELKYNLVSSEEELPTFTADDTVIGGEANSIQAAPTFEVYPNCIMDTWNKYFGADNVEDSEPREVPRIVRLLNDFLLNTSFNPEALALYVGLNMLDLNVKDPNALRFMESAILGTVYDEVGNVVPKDVVEEMGVTWTAVDQIINMGSVAAILLSEQCSKLAQHAIDNDNTIVVKHRVSVDSDTTDCTYMIIDIDPTEAVKAVLAVDTIAQFKYKATPTGNTRIAYKVGEEVLYNTGCPVIWTNTPTA